jgi:DNA-binding MarR family transcriptional regulator
MSLPTAERRAARIALACRIYQARLDRSRFFQCSIFSDSGWDALLAIYVFNAAGRTLSAGELCNATSDTSLTSSLRMQRRLVDLGHICRVRHPSDRRRVLVELTADGQRVFEDYLDHLLDNHLVPAEEDDPDNPELIRSLRERVSAVA